ncbi:MAG: hypothetical protein L6R42_009821 [Xanthoria sp. 1 TBL-2021]|nr:MAG: hypothetical protein L6R42_009821 [Xanthoria sp. 1 TBL-2021]
MHPPHTTETTVDPNASGSARPSQHPFPNSFVAVSSLGKTTEMPTQAMSTSDPPLDKPEISRPPQSLLHRSQSYFTAEVSTTHVDVLFLWCCFISGLVDSTIYNAFGTFVSMQTGNTIFLGLGGATPEDTSKPYGWAKSLVSIACFCLGCLAFSHATHYFGKLRRITLVSSFLVQTIIILIAAMVVEIDVVEGRLKIITDDIDWYTVVPIALLSFQSAGQIVGSRAVNLSELPTVVLTSMLHDIFTDRKLVAKENLKRNRRVLAFFAILIGAICGGFIGEGTERMQVPLWIAGGIKFVVTLAWVFWPEKKTSIV